MNLTIKTKIDINLNLKEIFFISKSKNKIYFKNKFVSFSPESFINIENNKITTFPIKGTILASKKNSQEELIKNKKELAEHIMIVDLMRNDLSKIGIKTEVDRFRYLEKIGTKNSKLFHTVSQISTNLNKNEELDLFNIFSNLLPAGSITGTPKISTINILKQIEEYNRGFYTGIFGIFDGKNLYSSVIIRYIEKDRNKFFYKSGGGITIDSSSKSEYQEYLNKIYIPY